MNIENYAKEGIQYYHLEEVPGIIRKLLKTNVKVILDAGCGDGNLLYALKENGLLKSKKVIGVDLSSSRVKLVQSIDPRFTVRVDNVETLKKIKSSSIDLVISAQVIEHVDDKKMLKTLWRVMKPGGLAYISTVFKKPYAWYYYKNAKGEWSLDPTHLREYTADRQLLDLAEGIGFSVENSFKNLFRWRVIHPILKVLKIRDRYIFENKIFNILGRIKLPIRGYYSWSILLKKAK